MFSATADQRLERHRIELAGLELERELVRRHVAVAVRPVAAAAE